jgi:hypothetical protein
MSAEQYAIAARDKLVATWPALAHYDQARFLCVLEDAYEAVTPVVVPKEATKIPPSLTQVMTYFRQIGSDITPERFFDFYESKGWTVGKSKMKNWHAAANRCHREWQRTPEELAAKGKIAPLTEWERSKKMERLKALNQELHELRHPGGSAYPVFLAGGKAARASELTTQILRLQRELE